MPPLTDEVSPSSELPLKALFLQALECASQQEAVALVAAGSGDDKALRAAVLRLLRAHWQADPLLDAADLEPLPAVEPLQPGQKLRGYTIDRLVGEGGMGLVYLAHQTAPLKRHVAVKVLKPGIDTRDVLQRFHMEQRALAALNHPHIARIFEGGQTNSGLPYFVLEYVDGQPLTTYCDQKKLPIRQRLELWLKAAEAVEHAHRRGILHRDLKPSNVLASDNDIDKPVVKVIDFGLAKLTELSADSTIITHSRMGLGTPRYMSPEQKGIINEPVDTRTDVFALGVILNELMIGSHASSWLRHEHAKASRLDPDSSLLSLKRGLSCLPAVSLQEVAEQRSTDAATLNRTLRGELDWIAGKALQTRPERRYQSTAEFAMDIRAYLSGELVQARPPSLLYRWRKTVLKHRVAASFLALFVVSALTIVGVSRSQTLLARKAEQDAKHLKALVEQSQARARRLLYASDIRLAGEAWIQGDALEARELLNRHAPNRELTAGEAETTLGFEWHFLNAQLSRSSSLLEQREQPLVRMVALPNSQLCLQTGLGQPLIHDLAGGTTVPLPVEVGSYEWRALASAATRGLVALGSSMGELSIIDTDQQAIVLATRVDGEEIVSLAFIDSENQLAIGTLRNIILFDFVQGKILRRWKAHQGSIYAISLSQDQNRLVLASDDQQSSLWDLEKNQEIARSPAAPFRLTAAALSSSGEYWIDADVKGGIRLLSATDGLIVRQWQMPSGVDHIAFSSDERWLAVGCRSGSLHVLRLNDLSVDSESNLKASAFTPLAGTLAEQEGLSNRFRLKSREGNETPEHLQIPVHDSRITGVLWESENTILTTSRDGRLRRTALSTPQTQRLSQGHPVIKACVSRNSRFVGYADEEGIYVFDRHSNQTNTLVKTPPVQFCSAMAMHPNGDELISLTRDGWLYRWRVPQGNKADWPLVERRLLEPAIDAALVRYSANGKRLLAASRLNDLIRIYTDDFSKELWELEFTGWQADLSRDGRWLAMNSDQNLFVYDVDQKKLLKRSNDHHVETITDLAFTPDGKRIITTGDDRAILSWNWQTDSKPNRIGIHPDGVPRSLAISSDGRTAVTCSRNGQTWTWSLEVSQKLVRLSTSSQGYHECHLSADDRILILRELDGPLVYMKLD